MKIIRERSFFITLGWDGGFVFCPCFFLFLSFLCVCGEGSRGRGGGGGGRGRNQSVNLRLKRTCAKSQVNCFHLVVWKSCVPNVCAIIALCHL